MNTLMCDIDWPTLLAFIIVVLTIIATTFLTIRNQNKAINSQLSISRETADRDKEKVRSEFISTSRQAWINSLRDEVSSYISEILSIWDLLQQKEGRAEVLGQMENPEYAMSELSNWSIRYGTSLTRAEKSRAKVSLLLNRGEPPSLALMCAIDVALKLVKEKSDPASANSEIIDKLQPILKAEWKRVKKLDGA